MSGGTYNNSIMAIADAAANRIGFLFAHQSEANYIGEEVSILEHSRQAYECALNDDTYNDNPNVAVAAVLHDVGHMLGMEAGSGIGMEGCGVPHHETIGGDFLLSLGVDTEVAWLVSNHVNAKRYLVWKNPQYELSDASRTTLRHQGGPMDDNEAKRFEESPGFQTVLRMRRYDEAAKVPGKLPKPSIGRITDIVRHHVMKTQDGNLNKNENMMPPPFVLSSEQLRFYKENGYLVIKGLLGPENKSAFGNYLSQKNQKQYNLSEIANNLFAKPHRNMLVHKEEVTDSDGTTRVQICRVENFCKTIKDWGEVSDLVEGICGELFGEKAILFKDKLNYKLPGGGGFLPHQDATAYRPDEFALTHISVMVAIDGAKSDDVGPLQFAKGRHQEGVFSNQNGVIVKDVEDTLNFVPLYVDPGDVVFFSSYAPHRSFENKSDKSRRLAYLTYNKLSEGDFNERYYAAKLSSFRDGTGGTISINHDFGGKIVR